MKNQSSEESGRILPTRHVVQRMAAVTLLLCGLGACTLVRDMPARRVEQESTYGAQIGIVNHTNRYIYSATVDGRGGGHSEAFNAGIGNMCCATLPVIWHPGLKVSVTWDMPAGREHVYKTKTVDVEKYGTPGSLYLHFFPDDEIRVVVTMWAGDSKEHPIPPPHR